MLMAAKLCACMLIGNAFQQQNLLALKLPTSSVQDPQVPLSLQKSMAAVCAYCLWAQASNFQPHCVQASVVANRTVFLQLWISPSSIHPMEEPAYQHTSEMRLLAVIVIPYKFYKIHGWRSFHARKAEAPTELDYQNGQEERRLSQLCGHFCNSTAD